MKALCARAMPDDRPPQQVIWHKLKTDLPFREFMVKVLTPAIEDGGDALLSYYDFAFYERRCARISAGKRASWRRRRGA